MKEVSDYMMHEIPMHIMLPNTETIIYNPSKDLDELEYQERIEGMLIILIINYYY